MENLPQVIDHTVRRVKDGLPRSWRLPVVDRLVQAGAILLGKTNVPPYSQGWQTWNDLYGTTSNPWDLSRSPGGSSGGGATALAAGLTALDAGSDIGGSLRNPAHFCGIWSHRPTYGTIDVEGHALPGGGVLPDLAVSGPMTRSARDLALVVPLMTGPRREDLGAWRLELPPSTLASLAGARVALVMDHDLARVDGGVRRALERLGDALEKEGAMVARNAWPNLDLNRAHQTFLGLADALTAPGVPDREFRKAVAISMVLSTGNSSAVARYLRNITMRHRSWLELDLMREQIRAEWAAFFRGYDVFLCPAAATTAVPHAVGKLDHQRKIDIDGKPTSALDQLFWAGLAAVAGLPVTTAPLGPAEDGLPVGVQIIGARHADLTCIGFASLLEEGYAGFRAPPAYV